MHITNSQLPPACVLTESEMIEIERERPHSQSPPSDASSLVLGAGITSSPFNLMMSPNVDNFANIGQRPYTAHSPSTYTPILPPVDAMVRFCLFHTGYIYWTICFNDLIKLELTNDFFLKGKFNILSFTFFNEHIL